MALALRDWLPMVLQAVKPWMSEVDIPSGAKWRAKLDAELEGTNFGISCVTPENQYSTWLNFEAGALGKAVKDDAAACVLLAPGMAPTDLKDPLASFQAVRADRDGVLRLVSDVNKALGASALPEAPLVTLFELTWPRLEQKLGSLPPINVPVPERSLDDKIDEILRLVRGLVEPDMSTSTDFAERVTKLLRSNLDLREKEPVVFWSGSFKRRAKTESE